MIWLSYNCRGLANPKKRLALKRLIYESKCDIIYLQETLCTSEAAVRSLQTLLPGWILHGLDACGRSGSLVIGINPRKSRPLSIWGGRGFLGMDIFMGDLGIPIRIINIYGPNQNRLSFWQNFLNGNHITPNTVLGGDFNFSLGVGESWGQHAQSDPIAEQMNILIDAHRLVDIPMNKKLPTWHNQHTGEAALGRRLDRFMMHEELIQLFPLYRQWVSSGGLSDHHPILLQVSDKKLKPRSPFKFFAGFLKEPEYMKMVSDFWTSQPPLRERRKARDFCDRLKQLKALTETWARTKRISDEQLLKDTEDQIALLTDEKGTGYLTDDTKTALNHLLGQKSKILQEKEELWRLKSRAIWLKAGDCYTKFFHNLANGRKASNTIWKLPCEPDGWATTHQKLAKLGVTHFKQQFTAPNVINLPDIINLAGNFPRFVGQEDIEDLTQLVTLQELESTLKWFKKDKSPGPDGWPVEFYLAFYDMLGEDLLDVIEESRITGHIHPPMNQTYIALIPKTDDPSSFNDFRPISLCNCLYKIIAKIIANRIKPILSSHISAEQFAFLQNRHIQEAIGTAQEALHSIKLKNLKGISLKIDLAKAFDKVNWLYLKMILTHLGFPHMLTNWIMGCISSVSFAILINGSASALFNINRGIRQGCPLSPLLFLIVMEGLSRLIATAKRNGDFSGLKITDQYYLTHLLFVDDILIFLNGSIRDSIALNNILQLFCKATGMEINGEKLPGP